MSLKGKLIKSAVDVAGKVAIQAVDSFTKHGTNAVVKQINMKKKSTVRIPVGAEAYYHRNFKEVNSELTAYGFTNITLVERKDLVMGLLTKEGAIEEISIDGKADFKKNAKFRSDVRVVIIYHAFRE